MDKSRFWKLIDDANRDAAASGDIAGCLSEKLADMDIRDVLRWQQIFYAYLKMSYKNKLWAAAYVINGGCGDDGFDYFRCWLIAQGKDVFLGALADPDSLAKVDVEMEGAEYEEMFSVSKNAYLKKLGMSQPDSDKFWVAYEEHASSEDEPQDLAVDIHFPPDIDLEWEEGDLESVVPALCAKFHS